MNKVQSLFRSIECVTDVVWFKLIGAKGGVSCGNGWSKQSFSFNMIKRFAYVMRIKWR